MRLSQVLQPLATQSLGEGGRKAFTAPMILADTSISLANRGRESTEKSGRPPRDKALLKPRPRSSAKGGPLPTASRSRRNERPMRPGHGLKKEEREPFGIGSEGGRGKQLLQRKLWKRQKGRSDELRCLPHRLTPTLARTERAPSWGRTDLETGLPIDGNLNSLQPYHCPRKGSRQLPDES